MDHGYGDMVQVFQPKVVQQEAPGDPSYLPLDPKNPWKNDGFEPPIYGL